MKKWIMTGIMLVLCMGVLTGCKTKLDVDTDTVYLQKKGAVISADVEKLDKDYYDETELDDYITETVEEYKKENGKQVSIEDFSVEEDTAKLCMKYKSYEDYTKFNGIQLYSGTVVTAQAEGYDFNTDFSAVSEGEKGKKADKSDVTANEDYKVAVIKANIDVKVDGEILYVSTKNTKLKSKDTVTIASDKENQDPVVTYIIYK